MVRSKAEQKYRKHSTRINYCAIEIISRGYLYLLHQKIKLLMSSAEPSLEGISIIKKILHI